jgi:hypothetical protein
VDTFDALYNLQLFFGAELALGKQKPYLDAVKKLETAARLLSRAGLDIEFGTTLFWVSEVHESIISDIRAFEHAALALMAHFAVFMAALEKTFWYLRGWGKAIICDVNNQLSDQPRMAQVLKWPEKKVWELAL